MGGKSQDASALPCTGISATIDVVAMPQLTGSQTVAAWAAVGLANDNWQQIGYYCADGDDPEGFYQIWDLTNNTVLTGGSWAVTAGPHQFEIVYSGAGNVWDFMMDGTLEGSYDVGAAISVSPGASQPFEALLEQQNPPFTVPTVTFPVAMYAQQNGVWNDVATASSYSTTSTYGVAGRSQNSSLAPDEIQAGTAIASISSGTALWSGLPTGIKSNTLNITVT